MPLLIMEYQDTRSEESIRLHILSPLISEAVQFLQQSLTGSVQNIPISMQPFNRGVQVGGAQIECMEQFRLHCRAIGAVQV